MSEDEAANKKRTHFDIAKLCRRDPHGEKSLGLELFYEGKLPSPEYVGMTQEEAVSAARSARLEVRIVAIDGWFAYASSVQEDRLNLIVEAGLVTRAWKG